MRRKPISLRTAVLGTVALTGGATAGSVAEAVGQRLGYTQPSLGHLATAATAVWLLGKLDSLIESD